MSYIFTWSVFLLIVNSAASQVIDVPKFVFEFDGIVVVNGTDDIFKLDQTVAKKEGTDSMFIVQANIDQLIEVDDDWKVDVSIFRADKPDGTYVKFLKMARVGVCTFLKTVYRKHFYEKVKDYSNLPHYDKCPLPVEKYWVKDYPFDANTFKNMARPGHYRIDLFLILGRETKAGIQVHSSVKLGE